MNTSPTLADVPDSPPANQLTRIDTQATLEPNAASPSTSPTTLAASDSDSDGSPTTTVAANNFSEKVKLNPYGFRDPKLQIFAALSYDHRLTMLLLALQLFEPTATAVTAGTRPFPVLASSTSLHDYAAGLARSYDVMNFDIYSLLIQHAHRVIHQLREYKLRAPDLAPSTSPVTCTSHTLSPEDAADPLTLRLWVQANLETGLARLISIHFGAPGGASFAFIATSRIGQAAVARERNLLSYFWDEEQFSGALQRHACAEDVATFRAFSSTPRAIFLAHVARIGALVEQVVLEGVPLGTSARIRETVAQQRCRQHGGGAWEYCAPPISLDELRAAFDVEISRLMKATIWRTGVWTVQGRIVVQTALQLASQVWDRCSEALAVYSHRYSVAATALAARITDECSRYSASCLNAKCAVCRPLRYTLLDVDVDNGGLCRVTEFA